MSTFGGLMVEYPQLAIDRFQGPAVLRAGAYFLSHAHADHMVGLDTDRFARRLHHCRHIKLYCSEVTREFLLTDRRFAHLERSITSLPIEEPATISIQSEIDGSEKQILVTLLPAGHCPGSVMFLFEGDQGTVLYTGDFRFAKGEAARMTPLHSGGRVKDIRSVYVDTTFCVPEAMHIPSREQSKDALLDLVGRQIEKSPTHMVRLACKAKYGYEYLFVEISKEFNTKVHVSPIVMAQYERVPDLAKHLTTDGSRSQVHACRYMDCSMKNATDVLVIVPSTMWFTSHARPSEVIRLERGRHRLCFSFHSSMSEIRDFIGYLRPVNIHANVIPYNNTEELIQARLQDLKRGADEKPEATGQTLSYRPLGQLKKSCRLSRRKFAGASCSKDDESEDDFFNSSPPPLKKTRQKPTPDPERFSGRTSQQNATLTQESGDSPVHSPKQSYLAMDDSDLSSEELDQFDSAPGLGQSPRPKDNGEGASLSGIEEGDCFEASWVDYVPHRAKRVEQNPAGQRGEDRGLSDSGKVSGFAAKQTRQESKRAEIDDWLRYLPGSEAVATESGKIAEAEPAATSPSSERHSSPELSVAEPSSRNDRGTPEGVLQAAVAEMNSSQAESDRTEDYTIEYSQEAPHVDFPCDKDIIDPSEDLPVGARDCKFDQCSENFDEINSTACERNSMPARRDKSSPPKKSSTHTKMTSFEDFSPEQVLSKDPNRLPLQDGEGPDVKSSSAELEVHRSEPHKDVGASTVTRREEELVVRLEPVEEESVRSPSVAMPTLQCSPSASDKQRTPRRASEHHNSQPSPDGTASQSQETFLPSSQGSVASRCSSDFDIPCTPEGKGLLPDQLQAVRVMVASEEVIPLASCRKKIQLD